MNLTRKIASTIATGALLFTSFATPAFAATTIQITGNGSDSDNTAVITTTNSTAVVQSNDANISNNVDVDADTGNNDAKDNTGGDVSIDTGDVDTEVTVSNTVNSNSAEVDCCQTGDTEVLISGNGSDSENKVKLEQNKEAGIAVFQSNDADIDNDVDVDADTGDNDAEDNTGGDVTIETGDVDTKVTVSNSGNVNSAQVGGDNNGGGSVSARITGNGSDSKNEIKLGLGSLTELVQSNDADIDNDVDVDADTGDNDAEDNTGGDVTIETGDVDATVEIDNMVNFNAADVDCGCLLSDLLAKISGNGTDSKNKIEAELGGELLALQSNCAEEDGPHSEGWGWNRHKCGIDNDVYVDGDTGGNEAEDNTGDPGGDPSVTTGDVDANVDLNNSGNVNVFGDIGDLELPNFDFSLDISLDLNSLLALLGLS